jgi:general stress protein CsbA
MEYVVIVLSVLSLGALTYATYLLTQGNQTAYVIFVGIVLTWIGLYLITHQTRLRRRKRW